MSTQLHRFQEVCIRICISLLGSYAFIWGLLAVGIVASVTAGAEYEEAYTGFKILGFLVYLALFLWSFATRRLIRAGVFLFGGGAVMTALALTLQNQLLRGA